MQKKNKNTVKEISGETSDHHDFSYVLAELSTPHVQMDDDEFARAASPVNVSTSPASSQSINLAHLVAALNGNIAVKLSLAENYPGVIHIPNIPEGGEVTYDEGLNMITVSGSAAIVRMILADLQFMSPTNAVDMLAIEVDIIHDTSSFQQDIILSMEPDSGRLIPLSHLKSKGASFIHHNELIKSSEILAKKAELFTKELDINPVDPALSTVSKQAILSGDGASEPTVIFDSNIDFSSDSNVSNDSSIPSTGTQPTGTSPSSPATTSNNTPTSNIIETGGFNSAPPTPSTGIQMDAIADETYTEDTPLDLNDIVINNSPTGSIHIVMTLSDPNAGSFNTATQGGATSTYNAVTGEWEVTGSVSDINSLLANLQFTPNADYDKDFTVGVEIDDTSGGTITDTITMTANAVDDPVTLATNVADQTIQLGQSLNFDPVTGTFTHPDTNDTLTYTAELAGGGALPAWLSIDSTTGVITGTPTATELGTVSIRITATDQNANSANDVFDLTVNSSLIVTNDNVTDTYTEDTTFDLTDINISTLLPTTTVTLVLSDNAAGTLSTATSGSVTSTFNPATGIWQASGDVTDVNILLAGIQFTPAQDYESNITLAVVVDDGVNPQSNGTVTLNANAVNDAPVLDTAQLDQIVAATNAFNLDISGNFSDVDTGDSLTYTAQLNGGGALPGWLSINAATGVLSGTPGVGDIATLTIDVTATDSGGLQALDTFVVDVVSGGLIIGTPNTDLINGNASANEIWAREDNDTVYAGAGNDTVYGEDGDDLLYGEDGLDTLEGGLGNDTLIGGDQTSADRQDSILGGDGDDYIFGGYHHDTLRGEDGDDYIDGGLHNDNIFGGNGNDFLSGGNHGTDFIRGEAGNNTIVGGAVHDYLYAGTGRDVFMYRDFSDSLSTTRDRIYFFDDNEDLIDLSALGLTGIGDLSINFVGGWMRIENAANNFRIDVQGNKTLTADDFIFSVANSDIDVTDQIAQTGNAFSLTLPAGMFASIDDGNLDYTLFTQTGEIYPIWLDYNEATGVLSGTPTSSDIGLYDLVLRATNGSGQIAEDTFQIVVSDNVILGTPLNDTLNGTTGNDAIYALASDDSVLAGDGTDLVFGAEGNDTLLGENGEDTLYGGDGNDYLDGGLARDTIYGGDGDDIILGNATYNTLDREDYLYGEGGNDYLYGGYHHDRLYGGDGNDTLVGDRNNDYLYAGSGTDFLDGGMEYDFLYGGAGLNIMDGGAHRDYLYGGTGTDIYTFSALSHTTTTLTDRIYYFDQGTDKIDLSKLGFTGIGDLTITQGGTTTIVDPNSTFKINVMSNLSLNASDFIFAAAASDGDIVDQEHIVNTAFNVTLGAGHFASIDDGNLSYVVTLSDGSALPSWLSFDEGSLTLSGTPDNTQMGAYDITIRAINGSADVAEDTFILSIAENIIYGTPGQDTLNGTADADVIKALGDDDSVQGGDDADLIYGAGGDDTLEGQNQRDTIYGGDGNDYIDGGFDRDTVYGGDGNDTILGNANYNTQDREDYLYGEDGDDYLYGGYHHDRLYGGNDNDTLVGDRNNDYLYAGAGNDVLLGGREYDFLYGQSGNNLLDGGMHRDYLYGGTGQDIYKFSDLTHSTTALTDRIYNFDQGTDKIDLSLLGFTGIGDLTITQGGTTTIVDPNSTFKINVMSNVALAASDFIFAAGSSDGDLVRETTTTGAAYLLTLPGGHFVSIDDGNLTYSAVLSNGNALPSWLSVDSSTGNFSGTPSSVGLYEIVLRATNGSGVIAEDTFELVVADNIINGTPAVDTLAGTANDDAIFADADDDSVTADDGDDVVYGEAGNDTLDGELGNDTLRGGDGDDLLKGWYGNDTLYGDDGDDTLIGGHITNSNDRQDLLYGGAGKDLLDGGYHHDTLYGGDDEDVLHGGRNNDSMYGGDGDDILHGGYHNDRMYGNDGDDILMGWHARDSLYGGDGDDIFSILIKGYSAGGNRELIYDFVQGDDKIDISWMEDDYDDVNDFTITNNGTWTYINDPNSTFRIDLFGVYTLTNADFIFERSEADQDIPNMMLEYGDTFSQALPGGAFASIDDGNLRYTAVQVNGEFPPEWLYVDPTTGEISGIAPDASGRYDIILRAINKSGQIAEESFGVKVVNSITDGTGGNDTLTGDNTENGFRGLGGDDLITTYNGTDGVEGGAGNDTIIASWHDDYLDGGTGDDSIDGGFNRDLIYGGDGNDTLIGGSNTSNSDRQDTIYGGDGDDEIYGGRYHDSLYGDDGNDTIYGQIHNDTLRGGDGDDELYGDQQNDLLYGDAGNDTIDGGANRDVLYGGLGADVFVFAAASHSTASNTDKIMDFAQGTDIIDLSALGLTGFGDLTISDNGTVTTVTDGGTFDFDLQGVYTLTVADFIL